MKSRLQALMIVSLTAGATSCFSERPDILNDIDLDAQASLDAHAITADANIVDADVIDAPCSTPDGGPCCETNEHCDDGNDCTTDTCNADGTCTHTSRPANTPCDDGMFCNGSDQCDSAGNCTLHAGDPCSTGNECSTTCNESADTCFDPAGTACTDDGEVCTRDVCDGNGTCTHPGGLGGTACQDNVFCNGADTCDNNGGCTVHAGDPCLSGDECADSCNEADKNCFDANTTLCTDDGNACTNDMCDGAGSCGHPPKAATSPCDDGMFCNGTDSCDGAGNCSMHTGDPCLSGDECADSCNEVDNNCFDANTTACTDDGNACTDDVCDGAGACSHPDLAPGTSCDDGLFCNGADTCMAGACIHAGDPCLSGNDCSNRCDDVADTCFVPAGTACTGASGSICVRPTCNGAGACGEAINIYNNQPLVSRSFADIAGSFADPCTNCHTDGMPSGVGPDFDFTHVEATRAAPGVCFVPPGPRYSAGPFIASCWMFQIDIEAMPQAAPVPWTHAANFLDWYCSGLLP